MLLLPICFAFEASSDAAHSMYASHDLVLARAAVRLPTSTPNAVNARSRSVLHHWRRSFRESVTRCSWKRWTTWQAYPYGTRDEYEYEFAHRGIGMDRLALKRCLRRASKRSKTPLMFCGPWWGCCGVDVLLLWMAECVGQQQQQVDSV